MGTSSAGAPQFSHLVATTALLASLSRQSRRMWENFIRKVQWCSACNTGSHKDRPFDTTPTSAPWVAKANSPRRPMTMQESRRALGVSDERYRKRPLNSHRLHCRQPNALAVERSIAQCQIGIFALQPVMDIYLSPRKPPIVEYLRSIGDALRRAGYGMLWEYDAKTTPDHQYHIVVYNFHS